MTAYVTVITNITYITIKPITPAHPYISDVSLGLAEFLVVELNAEMQKF